VVNLYRLLRIGISDAELSAFVGNTDGGPYQAAALLLAAVIGVPEDGRKLLISLREGRPAEDVVYYLRAHGQARLADLIEAIERDLTVHRDVATYQQWSRTVARLSFTTYDLVTEKPGILAPPTGYSRCGRRRRSSPSQRGRLLPKRRHRYSQVGRRCSPASGVEAMMWAASLGPVLRAEDDALLPTIVASIVTDPVSRR
jgi:hypothetical protein